MKKSPVLLISALIASTAGFSRQVGVFRRLPGAVTAAAGSTFGRQFPALAVGGSWLRSTPRRSGCGPMNTGL